MFTVFEGQITFSGNLAEALRMITSCKTIREGVLRITSDTASGMIGIFLGQYITGAATIIDGDSKTSALSRLLFVKDGTFAFLDAVDEPLQELKQGLAIELEAVIDALGQATEELPLSPDSLITMSGASNEEMKVIDTAAEMEPLPEEALNRRARATYQRLVTVSQREREEREERGEVPPMSEDPSFTTVYITDYGRDHIQSILHSSRVATAERLMSQMPSRRQVQAREDFDARDPAPASHKRQQFQRLTKWQENAMRFAIIFWILFLAAVGGAMYYYRDILF